MSQSSLRNSLLTERRGFAKSLAHSWRVRRSTAQAVLIATLRLWRARRRGRRHLAEMATWSDQLLKDIGVSRDKALHEASKPFWEE